jgi:hypothetical protein
MSKKLFWLSDEQAHRHPVRQAGAKLSRLRLPRRRSRMVALMSLDPRALRLSQGAAHPFSALLAV